MTGAEDAFARTLILDNSTTCEILLNGIWSSSTKTCINSNVGFAISAGDVLNIPADVTLLNPAGRTFSTNPGGTINNFGQMNNSGTFNNLGAFVNHCGGVLNNSGTVTGNGLGSVPCPDFDKDGFPSDVDCNDGVPAIYPGAVEMFGTASMSL